jgi:hypothetical protein
MVKWETIPVKFTSDEKKILDVIKRDYDLSYNQTLRHSLEFLVRLMVFSEYHVRSKNKTLEGIRKISDRHAVEIESEIKQFLKTIPVDQQEKDYEEYSGGITTILDRFNEIFVKNRKRGRKPLERKRGRPKNLENES